MTIRVQNGKAEAIDPRPLHDDKGAINGLPLASDDWLHHRSGLQRHVT